MLRFFIVSLPSDSPVSTAALAKGIATWGAGSDLSTGFFCLTRDPFLLQGISSVIKARALEEYTGFTLYIGVAVCTGGA
jgi:hypothetical protein